MRNKNKIYAFLETTGVALLLMFLLWFVTIGSVKEEEEKELEIYFEDARMGGRSSAVLAQNTQNEQATEQQNTASPQEILTSDEESPFVPPSEEDKQNNEAEKRRKEEEQKRLEREKIEAERKAKEQAAIDKAKLLGALFGQNAGDPESNYDKGEGVGDRGNPVGHGSLNGNSWSLDGRDCMALPKPANNFKQEGKVVINIHVNELGNVVSARVASGSTISDAQTQELARKAALKAKFSPAESKIQMGTITYSFKLR